MEERREKQHPVIIRAGLESSLLARELSSYFKVRATNDCIPDYIFPTFSRSFIVLEGSLSKGDTERIRDMGEHFKSSFLLVVINNMQSKKLFLRLQTQVTFQPSIFPVQKREEIIEVMMNILQIAGKANFESVFEDTDLPAEMDKAIVSALLLVPGLKTHDCLVLQQGMGSLAAVSRATVEEIMFHTSLSAEKAHAVVDFFRVDKVK